MANHNSNPFRSTAVALPLHRLYAAILLVLLPLFGFADRFDDFVKAAMEEQKIPGVQFVVVYKGKVAMSRSYGFADVEKREAVTKATEFEIASVSKPFVATAAMML